jgi:hypothetical protein
MHFKKEIIMIIISWSIIVQYDIVIWVVILFNEINYDDFQHFTTIFSKILI